MNDSQSVSVQVKRKRIRRELASIKESEVEKDLKRFLDRVQEVMDSKEAQKYDEILMKFHPQEPNLQFPGEPARYVIYGARNETDQEVRDRISSLDQ